MKIRPDIAAIQRHLTNMLDADSVGDKKVAAVIGESSSAYSKSPALWNAAFALTDIDAVYVPFDVRGNELGDLLSTLKRSERFLGANVTVPHKVRIMDFLDGLDPSAKRIGAVNTIVRSGDGRLTGFNTDGEGFVHSILMSQPGGRDPFIDSLADMDVLLIGAGGSARAVAFHVADLLERGQLIVCNRTIEPAAALAEAIRATGARAKAIAENEIARWAPKVGLIINSTTKGQGGMRKGTAGEPSDLEPYSALAPARRPVLAERESDQKWSAAARADIEANNAVSIEIARSIPKGVRFYDLIYCPEETVFLRHGRLTGHQTMNGKAMIIHQAALAFARHVCAADLRSKGLDNDEMFRQILKTMDAAW
ncbi:MAG TPA: shikimate dehydrogenase [Candidatus Eisenbacteria bacterium]|nr:shikimate dehydrogenase [Candidatus Eisenbacteria bacterium]